MTKKQRAGSVDKTLATTETKTVTKEMKQNKSSTNIKEPVESVSATKTATECSKTNNRLFCGTARQRHKTTPLGNTMQGAVTIMEKALLWTTHKPYSGSPRRLDRTSQWPNTIWVAAI